MIYPICDSELPFKATTKIKNNSRSNLEKSKRTSELPATCDTGTQVATLQHLPIASRYSQASLNRPDPRKYNPLMLHLEGCESFCRISVPISCLWDISYLKGTSWWYRGSTLWGCHMTSMLSNSSQSRGSNKDMGIQYTTGGGGLFNSNIKSMWRILMYFAPKVHVGKQTQRRKS